MLKKLEVSGSMPILAVSNNNLTIRAEYRVGARLYRHYSILKASPQGGAFSFVVKSAESSYEILV